MTTPPTTPAAPPKPSVLPEGAHSSRFVRIPLPDFDQPGIPSCWVEIRNVGLMSQAQIEALGQGVEGIQLGEDGLPVDDVAALPVIMQQILKLIRSWSMWDADSDEDVPSQLPSPPATVDDLKRAPGGALKRVLAAIEELQDPR